MKPTNTNSTSFSLYDQYVQKKSDFGKTTYFNINTGENTVVPWGHLDWFNCAMSAVFTSGVIYLVGHILKVW